MSGNTTCRLPIAVRAYARRSKAPRTTRRKDNRPKLEHSPYSLTFDTETTTDASQRLRFGSFEARKGEILKCSGLFYDPSALSEPEIALVVAYGTKRGLSVMTRDEFIEHIFFRYAYDLSALCIGFNLPFDMSRLALDAATSKSRTMRGGFTFRLSEHSFRPRLIVKHLSSRAAFVQFTIPGKQHTPRSRRKRKQPVDPHRGHFVDVRTLAGALLSGSWSLASLSKHLDIDHKKLETDEHGSTLTEDYLDYAMRDVQVTWECFATLEARYRNYGLTETPLTRIYSEASLGKAYLKQMGVKPWREVQPNMPPELLGAIMSTYYGGRSEVRIRRRITRVLYCDFLSMYPTA